MPQVDYEHLRPYAATPKQNKLLDALKSAKHLQEAAHTIDMDPSNAGKLLKALKIKAARQDANQHLNGNTEGYPLNGTSILRGADGEVIQYWEKRSVDKERQAEIQQEVLLALKDEIKPLKPVKSPKVTNKDLLNCYIITDYHMGMLAWDEETGDDNWDTDKAEALLYNWFQLAIKQSPNSESAVLAQLGDFLHYDGLEAITPTGHNILDADSRFQKVVRVSIRVLRRVIDDLLKKHKTVHVLMAEGNHDIASSVWLRELFAALYEKEPRITVDLSPNPYYCYEHGKTSLFFHHGHKRKPANIDHVFAAKFRDIFGRTEYSYGHMGHLHHKEVKESNLMIIEQHRTLASNDAYASRGGWMTGRDASIITYHAEYGEVGRVVISPKMAA